MSRSHRSEAPDLARTAGPRALPPADRKALWILLALLCLGALLRGVHLSEFSRSPDFTQPHVDADLHNYWARGLAFGDWTPKNGNPDPEIRTTPFFRPPGYPYFLALLYKLGGSGYVWPRLAQMLLGLLSAAMAFRLAAPRFGAAVGLVWAGLMATNWVFIYFEGEFQEPALFIALLLATLGALLAWSERPTVVRAMGSGALLGAAALVRPNALLLAAGAIGWMLWVARRHSQAGIASSSAGALSVAYAAPPANIRAGRDVLALAAALILSIAPATLRNLVASGEFVPISTNGGINLFIGNNQNAKGLVIANTEVGTLDTCYDWPEIVQNLSRKLGHPVSHAGASRWFEQEALRFISTHPLDAARLLVQKALLFLGPLEPPDEKILQGERATSAVLRSNPWSFALFWALGLAGGLLFVVRLRGEGAPPAAAVEFALLVGLLAFAWFLSFLPFAVTARYRAPFVTLLMLFAAYFAVTVVAGLRAGRTRSALAWLGLGLGLVGLAQLNLARYEPSLAHWHYQRAIAEKNLGRLDAAVPEYEAALKLNPNYLGVLRDLGAALASLGRISESIPYFETALRRDPSHVITWMNLATAYEATGRFEEALAGYRRVLALRADAPRARQGVERLEARRSAPSEVRP